MQPRAAHDEQRDAEGFDRASLGGDVLPVGQVLAVEIRVLGDGRSVSESMRRGSRNRRSVAC